MSCSGDPMCELMPSRVLSERAVYLFSVFRLSLVGCTFFVFRLSLVGCTFFGVSFVVGGEYLFLVFRLSLVGLSAMHSFL